MTPLSSNPDKDPAKPIFLKAVQDLQSGKTEDAVKGFRKVLEISPAHSKSWTNLGMALLQRNKPEESKDAFQKSLEIDPDQAKVYNALGRIFHEQDDLAQALEYFEKSLTLDPDLSRTHNNFATLLKDLQRTEEAEEHYKKAIALEPGFIEALNNLGTLLWHADKFEEAEKYFEQSLKEDPANEGAYFSLATMFDFLRKKDRVEDILERAQKNIPGSATTLLIAARQARKKGEIEQAISLLGKTDTEDVNIHFERGQLFDRNNQPDKAFEEFLTVNALSLKDTETRAINKNLYPAFLKKMKYTFTAEWVKNWSPPPPPDPTQTSPCFILGFPRSGTTLLDQILSSHPSIYVAEEKPVMEKIYSLLEQKPPCPENLSTLKEEEIKALQTAYFDQHRSYKGYENKKIFVDKNPLYTSYGGLIHRLFPDARFVFALRHPCDAVLSCFMQRFRYNAATIQFLDLERTARCYADVMDLWLQYRTLFPLNVHTIRYEDVVTNFQGEVESLLSFIGVPWDDAVLAFDKTARRKQVKTASYAQVTEKLYTRARYRWKNYEKHLEPVLPVLDPYIKAFGYDS